MPAMDSPASNQLEEQLRAIIHHLYALMVQSYDYAGSQSANAMTHEIQALIQSLSAFSRSSHDLRIDVPEDIVQYVENGRNPDIYNREFIESAQTLNQQLKGRAEGYVQFRDALAKEMTQSMPELGQEVNEILKRTGSAS